MIGNQLELSQNEGSGSLIHVVEDDVIVRNILIGMISAFGFSVTTFDSPVSYLEYLNIDAYEEPRAIVTDIKMTEMNGYELINLVHHRAPNLKFVVITGSPEFEHPAKKLACFYLCKPFRPRMLEGILNTITCCAQCCERGMEPIIDDRKVFGMGDWTCPNELMG